MSDNPARKVELQLNYDKLLQKYQVQLAALYTVPIGILLSLIGVIGIDKLLVPYSFTSPLIVIMLFFSGSLLMFVNIVDNTTRHMRKLQLELMIIELQLAIDRASL